MSALETIKSQIEENSVLLYMKGTPNQPQCGFSSQTVQALMACGRPFSFVNILEHPDIRAELPAYACLLYTSPSPRDKRQSRMPSSA